MPLTSWTCDEGGLTTWWSLAQTPERAWSALTTPKLISQWLGKPIDCDISIGGRLSIDHGNGYVSVSEITTVEVATRLAMTWEFPDEHRSELCVELSTSEDGSSTVLRLEHSGLGDLLDSYRAGWMTHLSFLEAAIHGSPLASSQFWNLHATFNTLVKSS